MTERNNENAPRSATAYKVGPESQPAHLRGSDVFTVVNAEGRVHCVHRVRSNAEQCAAGFGAEVEEWSIHD